MFKILWVIASIVECAWFSFGFFWVSGPCLYLFFILFCKLTCYLSSWSRWWHGHVFSRHCGCGNGFNRRCVGGLGNTALAWRSLINNRVHPQTALLQENINKTPPWQRTQKRGQTTQASPEGHVCNFWVCVTQILLVSQLLSLCESVRLISCLSHLNRHHAKHHPPADEEHG